MPTPKQDSHQLQILLGEMVVAFADHSEHRSPETFMHACRKLRAVSEASGVPPDQVFEVLREALMEEAIARNILPTDILRN